MSAEMPPENRADFTLAEVVAATGAEVLAPGVARFAGVGTDTRGALTGKLFVALTGERFDGHAFLSRAREAGAVGALVSRDVAALPELAGLALLRVPDTLVALGRLARAWRLRWPGQLVAVAGSVGKTTTRSAITALLEALLPGAVHATRANLNNRVGVPLTLLALEPRHRAAVLELGTSEPGELAALAEMAVPDVAVLTRIALEHSEFLGDLDGIEQEEGALFRALGPGAVAVANADDPRALALLDACAAGRRLGYGRAARASVRIVERETLGPRRTRLTLAMALGAPPGPERSLSVTMPLLGEPGALATAAALAVAEVVVGATLDGEAVTRAFSENPPGEGGRLVPTELRDGTLLIDDTYNASPESVRAALATAVELARLRGARLVVALGEMRELGAFAQGAHQEIARLLPDAAPAFVLSVGEAARAFSEAACAAGLVAEHVATSPEGVQVLLAAVRPGDVVLVKGSRGVATERLAEAVKSGHGGPR